MDDETEPSLIATFPESERVTLNVGQVGKMLDTLKAFGAGYALMAGQVKPKKLFHGPRARPQGRRHPLPA